ncbi:MAG: cytochrome b/b6 domain-containing protein [Deltaproteobacteria bacterium]|jgi:Ni/Fe-hydrogenase 1 B-type cytochrome subunit
MNVPATREEHPWPVAVLHWVHLTSLFILMLTGGYIRSPYYSGGMQVNQLLHFTFMWVFILTAIVRVYWAFLGAGSAGRGSRQKIRDYHWFAFGKADRQTFLDTLKYYLFLRRSRPEAPKFDPVFKVFFYFWLLLITLQAISGLSMWPATKSFFHPLTYLVGGLAAMHTIHYFIMWIFIASVSVHIYLAVTELRARLGVMFLRHESKEAAAVQEGRP